MRRSLSSLLVRRQLLRRGWRRPKAGIARSGLSIPGQLRPLSAESNIRSPAPQPRGFLPCLSGIPSGGVLARDTAERRRNQLETGPATPTGKSVALKAELDWSAIVPTGQRHTKTAPPLTPAWTADGRLPERIGRAASHQEASLAGSPPPSINLNSSSQSPKAFVQPFFDAGVSHCPSLSFCSFSPTLAPRSFF